MSWFGGRHDGRRRKPAGMSDTWFWLGVKAWSDGRLRKIAVYLDRKTLYWNRGSKVIALAVFCVVFGGACLFLLMKAMGWFR